MARFIGIVLVTLTTLWLFGFVLAHFGVVVLVILGVGLIGRHLRQHGA
jgi:hypothetical protein